MKLTNTLLIGVLLIAMFALTGCFSFNDGTKELVLNTSDGVHTYTVEIADSTEERKQGLQEREKLEENTGMFFVYEEPNPKMAFWMPNMKISLDMIFFDKDMKVVDYFQEVPPCESESCAHYTPKVVSQYVLEVNAGTVDEIGLDIGDVGELK
ncbi:DUF192 domain-containing protein [Patescibacteria group bacterium]